jgi:preprotein translocase subunit SecG
LDTGIDIAIILISILLMTVILTQSRGSGIGSAFGGDSGSIYRTRRGIEKTLFNFTIAIAVVFVAVSILASLLQ